MSIMAHVNMLGFLKYLGEYFSFLFYIIFLVISRTAVQTLNEVPQINAIKKLMFVKSVFWAVLVITKITMQLY